MNNRKGRLVSWVRGGVTGALLMYCTLCASVAFAQSYQIVVNTTALAGVSGYIDLQLNPADLSAPTALASITDLAGSLSLFGTPEVQGEVSGAFPDPIILGNSTVFNDSFQSVLFGSSFSFSVTFSGDFATQASASGSSFALSLYGADGTTPLLTSDVSGSLIRFELTSAGVSFQAFPPDLLGSPSAAQVTPVPLPAAGWLLLSGLLGFARISRRSKSTAIPLPMRVRVQQRIMSVQQADR